jgi:hypothetical protein
MLQDRDDGEGCESTTLTYLFLVFWIFTVVVAIGLFARVSQAVYLAKRMNVLSFDTLGFAGVTITASVATNIITNSTRGAMLLTFDESRHRTLSAIFLISQSLWACLDFASLLSFGITMLNVLVASSSLKQANFRHATFIVAVALGISVFLAVIPLLVLGLFNWLALFLAAWAIVAWAIYMSVTRRFVKASSTMAQANMPASTQFNTIRLLALTARQLLVPLVWFAIGSAMYAAMWFIGRATLSSLMLGPLSALAVMFQFLAVLVQQAIMIRIIARQLTERYRRASTLTDRQKHDATNVTQNQRTASVPQVLFSELSNLKD